MKAARILRAVLGRARRSGATMARMDATTAAENLAANLERHVPTRQALLELSTSALVTPARIRAMLEADVAPCPREVGRIAQALGLTPAELYREPVE